MGGRGLTAMRAVVQRVLRASVLVQGELVAAIDRGLLILLGVAATDGTRDADWMAEKLLGLRIFENTAGKFDRSVTEIRGDLLVVSQFTLCADTRKGRRPSFASAAAPEQALALYTHVVECLRKSGLAVGCGHFGAYMQVSLVNDGPVTLVVDGPQ